PQERRTGETANACCPRNRSAKCCVGRGDARHWRSFYFPPRSVVLLAHEIPTGSGGTMTDPRVEKLANVLINYSCALKSGETVLIEAIDVPHSFTKALVRQAAAVGGRPLVLLKSNEVTRSLMMAATREQWDAVADVERLQMEKATCYI